MKKHIKLYEEYSQEPEMFNTRMSIEEWLEGFEDIEYEIHEDNSVSITYGSLDLREMLDGYIPVQFREVYADFNISGNGITSLKGSPSIIGDSFYCANNKLKTLEYCPKEIDNTFVCFNNNLKTLVLAPKEPWDYKDNPCTEIYDELGFTDKAHIESLRVWLNEEQDECVEFIRKLQEPDKDPRLYVKITKDKEFRIALGMESEELQNAYDVSKGVEGDFF